MSLRQPRRMFSIKAPALPTLMAPALLICLGFGCSSDNGLPIDPSTVSDAILPVEVLRVQRVQNSRTVKVAFGKLIPHRESTLGFQSGGLVAAGATGLGAFVKSGELLAKLDQRELESQRDALTEELNLARVAPSTPRLETRTQLEARVQQLTSQLESLEAQLARGTIVAPYDCVVVESQIDDGARVSPDSLAYRIIEAAPPLVEVSLPPAFVPPSPSSRAITVRLRDESSAAELDATSPVVDPAGQQRVRLKLSDSIDLNQWHVGETVEVEIPAVTNLSGYWLPLSALHREVDGAWFAMAAEPAESGSDSAEAPSTARYRVGRRVLQILQLQDESALVDGSLLEGELVIVAGGHRVVSGQLVTLANQSSEPVPPEAGNAQP